jgi:hypothetical protein
MDNIVNKVKQFLFTPKRIDRVRSPCNLLLSEYRVSIPWKGCGSDMSIRYGLHLVPGQRMSGVVPPLLLYVTVHYNIIILVDPGKGYEGPEREQRYSPQAPDQGSTVGGLLSVSPHEEHHERRTFCRRGGNPRMCDGGSAIDS